MSSYFHRTVSGMVTVSNMMAQVVRAKVKKSDPVSKVMYKQFKMVSRSLIFSVLQRFNTTLKCPVLKTLIHIGNFDNMSRNARKPVFWVSDQV